MEEIQDSKDVHISRIAVQMVEQYVEGLLSAPTLKELIQQELQVKICFEQAGENAENFEERTYKRIAQRICSRALYSAWRSSNTYIRECAFANMRRYLAKILTYSSHVEKWPHTTQSMEDVLHQTLEMLHLLSRRENGGPDDPDRFLKWTQTIALRQAYAFAEQPERNNVLSFEDNCELFSEQFVEKSEPLKDVLLQELRKTLAMALIKLRNPQYQQVLFYTYFLDMDGTKVAERMGVQIQEVYTWRRRALIALRKQPEIVQLLHSLRE